MYVFTPKKKTTLVSLLGLLISIVQLLCGSDAGHVGAKLVDGLHPFVVLVGVEDNTAT